jgi:nucleotide-binding universal stress UspA family protein
MSLFRTILHATDFSESAGVAYRVACSLAREHQARLVLLHVVEPPAVAYAGGVILPGPATEVEEIREKLGELAGQAHGLGVETRLVEGEPAPAIVRLASELKCGLIVLGTHGRRGLARLLMGSVAEHVLRKAPCPVLTVRQGESPTLCRPAEPALGARKEGGGCSD